MNIFRKVLIRLNPLQDARMHGMRVGKGVSVAGRQGVSFGTEPYLITLEDGVRISGNVKFFTHDGGTWAFRDMDAYKGVSKYGRIHIGERSFIGNGAMIMPGVHIGKRCVIGAGAVVTSNVPDHCVAAGVPARILSSTEDYAEKCKKEWENKTKNDIADYYRDKRTYLIKKYL